MTRRVQEFHFDLAHFQFVARIDPDQIRFRNAGHFAHAVRFVAVRVDLHRLFRQQFREAGDLATAHAAADVIGVVVRHERAGKPVVVFGEMRP